MKLPQYPNFQGENLLSLKSFDDRTLFLLGKSIVTGQQDVLVYHDYKYILNFYGDDEFYNLTRDPQEKVNLVDSETSLAHEYSEMVQRWRSVQTEYFSSPQLYSNFSPPKNSKTTRLK